MELQVRQIRKKDFNKVIGFAIKGMNFNKYMESKTVLDLYGRYFWYMELERATQVIAAYYGDRLAGVLLADMKGEVKPYHSFWRRLYVRFIDFVQKVFFKEGVGPYDAANKEMYAELEKECQLDGEICFLAADPDIKVKGIGTFLLKELEKREAGKRIYLYTDNNCTYQFYEHRGFERACEKEISLNMAEMGEVPLSCYLYSKVCENKEAAI